MLQRTNFLNEVEFMFSVNPIVAVLGPRQCGKTTLSKQYAEKQANKVEVHSFDLENSFDLERLNNPMLSLSTLKGLIIIDEIQRRPELFQILRVLIDRNKAFQKYLILGSASKALIRQSSETLAGRISYLELTPLKIDEVKDTNILLLRGGFPRSYLAKTEAESYMWRDSYIRTFLEQDIPNLGFKIATNQMRRFWLMLTHYHGQIFNASELGRSLDTSHNTIKSYLDILVGTFMIRILRPWHDNLKKRQVKSPKIYFRDSGIYHALNKIKNINDLLIYPKLGASWEGFAMETVITSNRNIDEYDCYFWATQSGAELDLLIVEGNKKSGFEFKYTDVPKITKSMRIAMEDLRLDQLTVVYPGNGNFLLDKNIRAVGLDNFKHTLHQEQHL